MAEEMESPTEHSEEEMHHHAEHSKEKWVGWVALTAAFLAGFAAITGLHAGDHANEALFKRQEATDKWNEYQAQKAKAIALADKNEILTAMGKPVMEADVEKLKERSERQADLKKEAEEFQKEADIHLARHKTLAPGVTMFQIAIAMAAITVLSKRKPIWYVSIAFGAVGVVYLLMERSFIIRRHICTKFERRGSPTGDCRRGDQTTTGMRICPVSSATVKLRHAMPR